MFPNTTSQHLPQPPLPNQPPNGTAPRDWSSGLCACCDDPSNCCITCCCPCITFGQIAEIIDRGGTSCALGALIYHVMSYVACSWLYSCTYRTKLRNLYAIKEDPCADFLVHCCCEPCALCQEYRELKYNGSDPSIGWTANVEKWSQEGTKAPPMVDPGMTR